MPVTSPVLIASPRWDPRKCNKFHEGGFNPSCNFPIYQTEIKTKIEEYRNRKIMIGTRSRNFNYHTDAVALSFQCEDEERGEDHTRKRSSG